MQHLGGPADHNEIGAQGPCDAGDCWSGVAAFPDKPEVQAEFAGPVFGLVPELHGHLVPCLLDRGVAERLTERGDRLNLGGDVHGDQAAVGADGLAGRPGERVPTGRRTIQSDDDQWCGATDGTDGGVLRTRNGTVLVFGLVQRLPQPLGASLGFLLSHTITSPSRVAVQGPSAPERPAAGQAYVPPWSTLRDRFGF